MVRLRDNSPSSWQMSQKAWRKQGWRDWISLLTYSFTAFSVHKSMSDHQSWVHQVALRNPNVSPSYWLRVWSESQKFRRALRGFSSPLIKQKSGFIFQSHKALGSCPQIFVWTLRVHLGTITAWRGQVLTWSSESTNQWIWRWNQSE